MVFDPPVSINPFVTVSERRVEDHALLHRALKTCERSLCLEVHEIMTSMLMAEWKGLRRGRPGSRFHDRYESARRSKERITVVGRLVRVGLAVVAFAIGVVLIFIPGPAILLFFITRTLLATESRALALMLDRVELGLRVVVTAALRRWRRLGLAGRIVVVLLGAAIAAAALVICWTIAFR